MKLWGGRFSGGGEQGAMDDFHSSIPFDCRLYKEDIAGSIAHADMLGRQGIISSEDSKAIVDGLCGILDDIEAGRVDFSLAAEDIHMNIEMLLTERIGEAGKRLHTGRSRNDQVALDARMYVRSENLKSVQLIKKLLEALLNRAEDEAHTPMPGFTHLQKAQPITLGHHIMAYFEMFMRDASRFCAANERLDEMPLGAGALAGTTYPLDREYTAKALGFSRPTHNSLDSVSDRDFIIEYLFNASMVMMHLSRFCEELILFSSQEFAYVEMDEAYSTGSSIMPQKKNPDAAELIRGKTGRVYGNLMALLTVMKGLPLAYNKDMQEDKEALFDAVDTLNQCLIIFIGMFEKLYFNRERMKASALGGFTNATDAADYLVKKGLPFREAHRITGELVAYCIENGLALPDVSLEKYMSLSVLFEDDIYEAISLEACVSGRDVQGGTAPSRVLEAVREGEQRLRAIPSTF